LRVADAVQLRPRLDPAAVDELLLVDRQLDPIRPQVVGDEERELGWDGRGADAELPRGAQGDLGLDLEPAQALLDQLVVAERGRVEDLDAVLFDLERVEDRDRGRAAAVVLQVEERVADPGGDLVEEGRRDVGRPEDQDGDGITSRRASTSGTWRT
jgi:hypothetical protein